MEVEISLIDREIYKGTILFGKLYRAKLIQDQLSLVSIMMHEAGGLLE